MIKADQYYKDNLIELALNGSEDINPRPKWNDNTPAYTRFITQVFEKYDISKGEFPIPTVRNTAIKTGIKEILWIYQKQSNSLSLAREMGINWWDEWDIGNDTIGERYGATIKKYNLMNQLLDGLRYDPFGRRHIIDLWQEESLNAGLGLKPCAFMTMWSVRSNTKGEKFLDLTLTQRSNDYIVAGYINKIQYVALQMMVAEHVGYKVGVFSHLVQNLHIYDRHMEAAGEILQRLGTKYDLNERKQPKLLMNCRGTGSFYDYTIDDFSFEDLPGVGVKLSYKLEIAI